jgi:hypothetical protein
MEVDMAGVGKCMCLMTGFGLVSGMGASYIIQRKTNSMVLQQASAVAKDGVIPIGGKTPDGKLWDGAMTVEQLKKDLNKKSLVSSAVMGLLSAVGTAAIAGITLFFKAKL